MPRESTSRLDFGYGWLRGEDWWGDPMSDNMVMLDALLHPNVISMTFSAPPAVTEVGDQYIVGPGASGLWAGKDGSLATRYDDRWRFVSPFKGMRIFISELDAFYWYNGSTWMAESDGAEGVDPNVGLHYDVLCSVGYPPEPLESVLIVVLPQAMTLPRNASGSHAATSKPPLIATQVGLYRNGTQIGSVMFPSNGFKGAFSVPSQVTFAAGDRLTMTMGSEVPPDFGVFGITLRMVIQT